MPDPRVQVVGPLGERGSVDMADLPAFIAQHGRVATQDELNKETFDASQQSKYGGLAGALTTGALGAVDTATLGGGTALLSQIGKDFGKAREMETALRGLKEQNPIAHALGSAAPLVAAPELGGEEAAAQLIQGEGALANAARWALPHLYQGTAESAWIEGGQGISEDILDHDLSAESFYVHAFKPETLYGGLLNVGAAGGFKALSKLTRRLGSQLAGRAGEAVATDARAIEDIVKSVQEAGGTSQEADQAISHLQAMTVNRAELPVEERPWLDRQVDPYIKRMAPTPDVARQYTRIYRDGKNVLDKLDDEMAAHSVKADEHMTSLVNDLTQMEDARLALKFQSIRKAADPDTIVPAADVANQWVRELRATLEPPNLPPRPAPPEAHLKQVLKEWKSQGVKVPQDPQAAEAFMEKAKMFAEASHASAMADHQAEVARLMQEREALVDPEIRRMFGDPSTRVGFSQRDRGKLVSLLNDVQREVNAGRKMGGQEGAARIFTAIDDSRAIVGHMAKFGRLTSDSAKMLERYVYNNRLRPMLEDSNIWGPKLAQLQSLNNDAVTHSIQAIGDLKSKFFGTIDNAAGRPIYTPNGNTKRFLEQLGRPDGINDFAEQTVRRVTESARARGAAMLQTMDLSPEMRSTILRSQRSAKALEELMDQAKLTAADAREIKAMKAREAHNGSQGILGGIATVAAAHILGPIGGGAVAAGRVAFNIAKNPVKTLEWISQFRKAQHAVQKGAAEESQGFLKGHKVPTVKKALSAAEREAAIRSIADVQRYQADPRNLAMAIKDSVGDMVEHTPKLAGALAQTMARGALALAKRAPAPLPPRFSDKPDDVRYANGALEKYWHEKQIVERPQVVLQLMRSGQLHQEDIQLMQEVVPHILSQNQSTFEKDLMTAKKKGELRGMSYQEQLSLSWMLGRPLDSSQDPGFVMSMQQSAASDPTNQGAIGQAAAGGGRPSKLNNINLERYQTLEERLEAS